MGPEMVVTTTTKNETVILTRTQELCASAERAVIDSTETLERGADLAKMIRDHLKVAEGERTALTGPLNNVLRTINTRFKKYTEPLEKAKALIDGKMLAYGKKLAEAKRAEEEARRKEEDAARQAEFPDEIPFAPPVAAPKPETVYGNTGSSASFTNTWDFEVEDVRKLPAEYLLPNEVAIRRAVREGVREIPGVRIFEKTGLRVR